MEDNSKALRKSLIMEGKFEEVPTVNVPTRGNFYFFLSVHEISLLLLLLLF